MKPPTEARHTRPGWFDHPWLSLVLGGLWLLMQQSLAPAHVLWAVVLALLVPRLVHGFLGPGSRVHAAGAMARLCGVVLWDIVVSNLVVARIVLDPRSRPRPGWVPVPLDTRHPVAVALFASIITMTPGTVSCVVDEERGQLLVHALDCDDAPAMAAQMKARYEQPLRRIFEGESA